MKINNSAKYYFIVFIIGIQFLFYLEPKAETLGLPPYKTINIPPSAFGDHFDMVQDNNNTLYVASIKGVKVFNGLKWQLVEIPITSHIRRLHYDNMNRVYVGGSGIIGYIEIDKLGQYKYTDITPKNYGHDINTIWSIEECNGNIFYLGLNDVFKYDPRKNELNSWHFKAKLGATNCYQQKIILQDRDVGLLQLENDEWVNSPIELKNNTQVYQLTQLNEDSLFLLPTDEDWRIIKNNTIHHLNLKDRIPDLNSYISSTLINTNNVVLGSSNGFLTFINFDNMETSSFKLTNAWISKIIVSNSTIIVLTEFEIFYIEWPSAIRILGSENGLSGSIFDLTKWNNANYVSSSSGVFFEENQTIDAKNQYFKKLNWTSNEVWNILPLNEDRALLAESQKLLLIDKSQDEKIISLTDIIYPRELVQSNYNPQMVFVTTEFDLRILTLNDNEWDIKKVFESRPVSIAELSEGLLILSTDEGEIIELTFNTNNGELIKTKITTDDLDFEPNERDGLKFLKQGEIFYAFNSKSIYKYENKQFVNISFPSLDDLLNNEELKGLYLNANGQLFGNTLFKFLYQDTKEQWGSIDLSPYLRGIVDGIKLFDDEIKILSHGKIITYLLNKPTKIDQQNHKLLMSEVVFNDEKGQRNLPLDSQKSFSYEQGNKSLTFSYLLNDFININKTLFRYRLIGNDDQWSSYFNDKHITLSKLPVGQYSLEVEAKDIYDYTYTMQPYSFNVTPVWYLATYAKILWVILSLATLYILLILFLKWREALYNAQKLELKKTIESKTLELKKANDELQKMAHQDGLTGLSNRLYLDDFIDNVINQNIESIAVMMLDMDYFKEYNDKNGHIAGDNLLMLLAQNLKKEIDKKHDLVARYGGEEFIIIIVNSNLDYVKRKAENIRSSIEDLINKISISIGISQSSDGTSLSNTKSIYELINSADKALYKAKKAGKNQVCFSH